MKNIFFTKQNEKKKKMEKKEEHVHINWANFKQRIDSWEINAEQHTVVMRPNQGCFTKIWSVMTTISHIFYH